MKSSWITSALSALACMLLASTEAAAVCTVSGVGMTMTPGTASTGTYTPPIAPAAQSIAVTITGRYSTNATAGTCQIALSFQRPSFPPATMANTGGGTATLPYTITSAAGGGNTLLFTGTSVSLANVLLHAFASAGPNLTNVPFTANLTIFVRMLPNAPQAAGSYSDGLTAWVFSLVTSSSIFSRAFTVTGTVNKVCTIGGVANPAADSANIPVSAAGAVNTAVISRSYASVACNTPSNVQLTSQNGAVRIVGAPPSGFTNMINYAASATFSGATATLNTSSMPTAVGPESGTAVSTTGATPSGTMSVTITPQANALRLLSGAYGDVLQITITPQ